MAYLDLLQSYISSKACSVVLIATSVTRLSQVTTFTSQIKFIMISGSPQNNAAFSQDLTFSRRSRNGIFLRKITLVKVNQFLKPVIIPRLMILHVEREPLNLAISRSNNRMSLLQYNKYVSTWYCDPGCESGTYSILSSSLFSPSWSSTSCSFSSSCFSSCFFSWSSIFSFLFFSFFFSSSQSSSSKYILRT